jgi:hypothetical protein
MPHPLSILDSRSIAHVVCTVQVTVMHTRFLTSTPAHKAWIPNESRMDGSKQDNHLGGRGRFLHDYRYRRWWRPSIGGALLSSRRIAYINPLSKVTSLLLQRCCCLCHDLAHLLLRFSVLLDASVYARVFTQAQFPIVVVLHALLKALLQHSVEQTSRRRG